MSCSDWSAFWLFDWKRPLGNPVQAANPLTWSNEIDIVETDGQWPNQYVATLHSNTSSSGGVPDRIEQTYPSVSNTLGQFHIYGALWTQDGIDWYVDNVKVGTAPAYPSTWQAATLILGIGPGGVNGGRSNLTPPVLEVDWVRVWSRGPSAP
jgi:beta-glucanase (GH16 family)